VHLSLTLVRMSASASRYIYSHLSFEFCGHLLSVLRRAACCCVLLFRCFMLFVIALIASTDWACFVVKLTQDAVPRSAMRHVASFSL